MKNINLLTSVALIASLGLVGCGGGSTSSQDTSNVTVSGTAIDPELLGATICLDLNQDENCTEGEPTAKTDGNGNFNLTVSTMQLEGSAPLLAIGGTDIATGDEFKGKLMADVNDNSQNITPLTTLAYEKIKENMAKDAETVQSGMEEMEKVLDLTSADIQSNIMTLANEGNITALKVALALQKSAEAINPKETIEFYANLSPEMNISRAKDLTEAISNLISDNELKIRVRTLVGDILNSNTTDPYILAQDAKDKAKKLGIDQDEMMDHIPGEWDMPTLP